MIIPAVTVIVTLTLVRCKCEMKFSSVYKCAVSPTGDKLYITNHWQHKLVTLARDGTPLECLVDRQFGQLDGIHVTPAGQVLVCADWAHLIIQVDSDGKKTLMTEKRGWSPESACYHSETTSIIVGQWNNNNILVLKVQ
ncbi:uncharacterized protein LOC127871259 [Dreissena polymorpha]|uniref:uncharacterized protein LOC127871259 n=1 Tax=Dreissena polymorpha TaxID=45954 RepID=UPI00226480DD|nr:uncharacterized protein LOC127871259 [Dreissena polymorpha]